MAGALTGCRILDFGIITAGAASSALLADLGAEVIKIESPAYRDPFRAWPGSAPPTEDALPPFFISNNRGKLGISLDLKHPEGRTAFLRLAAKSHVVLENFSRGVMDRLGLDRQTLLAACPDLIQVAISSQGCDGPDAPQVSFGSTLEAVGGLAWLTGYADGPPVVTGREINYPDQVVAIFAAGMVLTAWLARRRGRRGVQLDISQRELTSFLLGEVFLDHAAAGEPARTGNAAAPFVLQDCFLAQDGAWVAVSVRDADLPGLSACIGAPVEPDPASALAAWMRLGPASSRCAVLLDAGIAAAPALGGKALLPQMAGGGAFVPGSDGSMVKGMPFVLEGAGPAVGRPAPRTGEDTRSVLERVAGYSAAEVTDLAARGIIELG